MYIKSHPGSEGNVETSATVIRIPSISPTLSCLEVRKKFV